MTPLSGSFSLENGSVPPEWDGILRNKKVFISFSGGPDSCALFLLLLKWSKKLPFTLEAIHFHHHLRGEEADKDALFAEKFAAERSVAFQCINLHVPEEKLPTEGEEEAARRLRLAQWKKLCGENPGAIIATGHQKEDLLENFFLRLARGGNGTSLTSLQTFSTFGTLHFFRPLLAFSKKTLEEFLEKEGVKDYCIDKTNLNAGYCKRNFFRNHLFPLLEKEIPHFTRGMSKSYSALAEEADFLEKTAENAFARLSDPPLAAEFASLHPAISFRVLRLFLMEKLGEKGALLPDYHSFERFQEALKKGIKNSPGRRNFYRIPLTGIREGELVVENGSIFLSGETFHSPAAPEKLLITEEELKKGKLDKIWGGFRFTFQLFTREEWELLPEEMKTSSGKKRFFLDGNHLPFPLEISPRKKGEKMIPYSRKTPVPLKKFFNEEKLPPRERDHYPILRNGKGEVLLLPLFRRSSLAPLRESTGRILYFFCERLARKEK